MFEDMVIAKETNMPEVYNIINKIKEERVREHIYKISFRIRDEKDIINAREACNKYIEKEIDEKLNTIKL